MFVSDKWQDFEILSAVERELGRREQLTVQFDELLHDNLVDLYVPRFAATFLCHHPDEVGIPVGQVVTLFFRTLNLTDVVAPDGRKITVVCTDKVFYLPHIQQVLRYVFLS